MNDEPEWFLDNLKKDTEKQANQIIKTSNRWIWINLFVGIFDTVYAIWTDILVFKFIFAGIAIFMFYLIRTHHKNKKKAKLMQVYLIEEYQTRYSQIRK